MLTIANNKPGVVAASRGLPTKPQNNDKNPQLFLVPLPSAMTNQGKASLCLCRKVFWTKGSFIYYTYSPLPKNEADQAMKSSSTMSLNLVTTKNLLTVVDGKLIGVQQVHGRVVLGGPRFIISPSVSRVSSQSASALPNRPVANGSPHVSRVSQSASALPNRVVANGSQMKTANKIVVSNPSTGGNPKHALITLTPNQSTNGLAIPSTNGSVAASPKPLSMPVLTKHDHPYSTLEAAEIAQAPRLTKANNAADGKEGVPIAKPPRLTSGISKANQITKAQPRLLTRSPKTKQSASSHPSFAQLKVKFAWNSRRISSSSSDKNGVKSDETEDATKRPGPSSRDDDVPLPSLSDLRSDDKILRVALTRLGGKTLKRLGCDISSPLYTSLITDKSKSSRKPAAVDDADVDKTGDLACLVGVTTSPLKRKAVAVDEHHEDVNKTRDLSKKSFEPDRRSSRFTTSTLKRKPVAVDEDVDTDVENPGDISKSFEPDHRSSRLTTSTLKRKPVAVDEDVDTDVEKPGDISKSFAPDHRSSRLTTSILKRKPAAVDEDVDADVEKPGGLSKSFEPDRRSSRLTTSTLKRKTVDVDADVKKTRDLSKSSFEPDRRSSRLTTPTLKRKALAVGENVKKTRDLSTKSFEPDRRSSRSTTSTLKRKAVAVDEDVKKARDLSTDEPDRRSSRLTISTPKRKTGVVEVDDVKQTRDRSSFEPGRSLRLNTLIKLPDSKHIPTNDKVAYLKELLRSQKAMLGM